MQICGRFVPALDHIGRKSIDVPFDVRRFLPLLRTQPLTSRIPALRAATQRAPAGQPGGRLVTCCNAAGDSQVHRTPERPTPPCSLVYNGFTWSCGVYARRGVRLTTWDEQCTAPYMEVMGE